MKKIGCKAAILIGLAVLFLGGVLFAGPRGPRRHGRPGPGHRAGPGADRGGWQGGHGRPMMLGRILQKLDLTGEQTNQIKAIREANKEQMKNARKAVAEATKALRETAFQDTNEATIRAAAAALGNALGDKALLKAKTMASIKKVLTAEQITKFNELRAKMRVRVGKSRGRVRDPESYNRLQKSEGSKLRPRRRFNMEKLFETKDTNKDGKLTKEELQAGGDKERPRRFEWLLEKADADGDGALTTEELDAYKEKMKDWQPRRRGWRRW